MVIFTSWSRLLVFQAQPKIKSARVFAITTLYLIELKLIFNEDIAFFTKLDPSIWTHCKII